MELFQNLIELRKFRSTNAMWNSLQLNSPMSVGYVTNLIESRTFSNKEEWRDFYYQSGHERIRLGSIRGMSKELNLNYGRTEEELKGYGQKMYAELQKSGNPLNITLAECVFMVKYRVMGETWNGVIMREKNTIENMTKIFPYCSFEKVEGEADYKYAIDYEMCLEGRLVCALQIKPMSYEKGFSPEIMKAKRANKAKNDLYVKENGVPVYYVYSKADGTIINHDVVSLLKHSLQMPSAA
ncbi:MjaI family restriction endonuclease [Paenibacillus polymyxa]|uniref:MjaI family restriction endonuclease n=1 Tax=Paenibacillus polymyxa (strain SC2) TaxID=886882 RepID=E3EJX5_PAEPS|nr:MjaI family restriction endonuclease [Paenibacillus polymyxa]ADO59994.1 hypothetical protein PPSC2_28215 [Paenibacillus polymyxa SC2]WPQ59789.1 MjaI family restriction endonuclease [Paenibacillus polymyxa]